MLGGGGKLDIPWEQAVSHAGPSRKRVDPARPPPEDRGQLWGQPLLSLDRGGRAEWDVKGSCVMGWPGAGVEEVVQSEGPGFPWGQETEAAGAH